jgi:ketosteroid isomerase-like protein
VRFGLILRYLHEFRQSSFAWAWGRYNMTAESEPGKPMSLKGKWTATYRRQAGGSWLMASDIWNLDEPLTAA